jgi:prolyl 4-hydroxylase
LNVSMHCCEEPQIVRYQKQQLFDYHYDIIPSSQLLNGGQRIATLILYLNTIPIHGGGRTIFRDLMQPSKNLDPVDDPRLSIRPVQGTALLFFPSTLPHGQPDERTLHQGETLLKNNDNTTLFDKYIIQLWIHQFPNYTATLPTPSNDPSKCSKIIQ